MDPLLGYPLTFYQNIVLPYDDASKTAEAVQKEVARPVGSRKGVDFFKQIRSLLVHL
jgi:hypothetical protein